MKKYLLLSAMVMGLALTSCESDGDAPITYVNATVNVGEQYTIPNSDGCDWKSGNPVIASVAGDKVDAHYVGTAKIWCAKGNFTIDVKPLTTLYVDPVMQWGAELKNIKSQLSSNDGWVLAAETETSLSYGPNQQAENQLNTNVTYDFETVLNDKGKEVTSLYRVVETLDAAVTGETVKAALGERYVSTADNAYKATDGTFTVALTQDAAGAYLVTYTAAGK